MSTPLRPLPSVLQKLPQEVQDYISHLEGFLNGDSFREMYASLQTKYSEMAEDIKNTEIKLDGEDKAFDRFLKLAATMKDLNENLEWLGQKIGIEKDDKKKGGGDNPVERRARDKK
jgi:hypothetical protein